MIPLTRDDDAADSRSGYPVFLVLPCCVLRHQGDSPLSLARSKGSAWIPPHLAVVHITDA
jgi:hypothetical protein